jgi:hypothetical protein
MEGEEIYHAAKLLNWKTIFAEVFFDTNYLLGEDKSPYPVLKVNIPKRVPMQPDITPERKRRLHKFVKRLIAQMEAI